MRYRSSINKERALKYAMYFVDNQTTIREVAKNFGISKSQIHYIFSNMTCEMFATEEKKQLVRNVKTLIEKNKQERHIRGGNATKKKYMCKKTN